MLKEYLLKEASRQAVWSGSIPGVQMCRFSLSDRPQTGLRENPEREAPLHFATIFCLCGCLVIRFFCGEPYASEAPGIFLLTDFAGLCTCHCSGVLCGILIAADAKAAKESLVTVCSTLGMKLDTKR